MKQKTQSNIRVKKPLHPFVIVLLTIFTLTMLAIVIIVAVVSYFTGPDTRKEDDRRFQIVASELQALRREVSQDDIFTSVGAVIDRCENPTSVFGGYSCEISFSAESQKSPKEVSDHIVAVIERTGSGFAVLSRIDSGEYATPHRIESKQTAVPCSMALYSQDNGQQLYISCGFSSRDQLHIKN